MTKSNVKTLKAQLAFSRHIGSYTRFTAQSKLIEIKKPIFVCKAKELQKNMINYIILIIIYSHLFYYVSKDFHFRGT